MQLGEEIRNVFANLLANRFRSFLTLLGVILGVGLLVFVGSLLYSAHAFMAFASRQASGEDIITISSRRYEEKAAVPLNRFDSRALQQAEALDGATVLNQYSQYVRFGNKDGQWVNLVGTTERASEFYALAIAHGRFLTPDDVGERTKVAVLGAKAAKDILPGESEPLGKWIRLQNERFYVIGILQHKPSRNFGGFRTWDDSVLVPETTFLDRFARTEKVSEIVVKVAPEALKADSLSAMTHLVHITRAMLLERHYGVENFRITDPKEQSENDELLAIVIMVLQGAIAGVSLVVGGINIMNIMLVTVTQRTREIGIRRSLGASRNSIRRQFLTEAAILAGTGGLLGVIGGIFCAWVLALILTKFWGFWPFVWVPFEMAVGFFTSLATGLFFGWFPAHRAANLSPIACLRHE